jgi:hypothetical protein
MLSSGHPPPYLDLPLASRGQQKTRRSGFFLTVPNPSGCLPGVVDHPDPERVLHIRVGLD